LNCNINRKTRKCEAKNIIVQQDDNSYTPQSSDAEDNDQNEYASPNLCNDDNAANEICNTYSGTDCIGDGGAQLVDKRKQIWMDEGNVCKKVRTLASNLKQVTKEQSKSGVHSMGLSCFGQMVQDHHSTQKG
jgi:hypothetical protein